MRKKKELLPDVYIFPGVFEDSSEFYIIKFPNFPNVYATGKGYNEAFASAKEILSLQIYMKELKKEELPEPTPIEKVGVNKKQVVCLIELDMKLFRAKMKGNYIKKTLTIPEYLNILAMNEGIDFSAVLREGIIAKLKDKEEKEEEE